MTDYVLRLRAFATAWPDRLSGLEDEIAGRRP